MLMQRRRDKMSKLVVERPYKKVVKQIQYLDEVPEIQT